MRSSVSLLMLLSVAAVLTGQEYFRSDPLGLQGDRIPVSEREPGWVLRVTGRADDRQETLLNDGIEQQVVSIRSDRTGREVRLSVGGELRSIERYATSGALLSEERYAGGELLVRYDYTYDDGQLVSRTAHGADGEREQERYRYWRDGSLRMVERIDSEEQVIFRYENGAVTSEQRVFDGFRETRTFDAFGRTVERTLFADGELLEREQRAYWGDPPSALERVTVTRGVDVRTERYNRDGVLVATDEQADGRVTGTVERVVENGLVLEEREVRDEVTYLTEYDYRDGALEEQRVFEDGELIQRIRYFSAGPPDRTETIYRDGAAVLEVDFAGEQRTEERVIRNGTVVRTRRFDQEGDA